MYSPFEIFLKEQAMLVSFMLTWLFCIIFRAELCQNREVLMKYMEFVNRNCEGANSYELTQYFGTVPYKGRNMHLSLPKVLLRFRLLQFRPCQLQKYGLPSGW